MFDKMIWVTKNKYMLRVESYELSKTLHWCERLINSIIKINNISDIYLPNYSFITCMSTMSDVSVSIFANNICSFHDHYGFHLAIRVFTELIILPLTATKTL